MYEKDEKWYKANPIDDVLFCSFYLVLSILLLLAFCALPSLEWDIPTVGCALILVGIIFSLLACIVNHFLHKRQHIAGRKGWYLMNGQKWYLTRDYDNYRVQGRIKTGTFMISDQTVEKAMAKCGLDVVIEGKCYSIPLERKAYEDLLDLSKRPVLVLSEKDVERLKSGKRIDLSRSKKIGLLQSC
ncbi:MAG: hypothetical protein LUE86_10680 [Clostridiales bacterium]|nr:hypothetical protein [Clostridiales bacterium]